MSASKKELRRECRARRQAIPDHEACAAAARVADLVIGEIVVPPEAVVAGYWPFPDELDPRPLMHALHQRGNALCLPVVVDKHSALEFRAWAPGDSLADGVFGTRIPLDDCPARVPDILLVPLLAFDHAGYRLGYGGGFYDRTLAALDAARPTAIGLAFAAQEIDKVPRETHDRRLDWIVTERAAHRII
jgi:5-formyltetrahydrofolate cyclo-ligase